MPRSLATVGDLTSRHQMTGRVRRRPRAPPSLRDSVRWCSDISRRRLCALPSLGDFIAVVPTSPAGGPAHLLLSEISSAVVPTSPVGGPARLLLSEISSVVAPSSPVGGPARLLLSGISFAGAPTSPAACGGAVLTGKENQRSSELDADFLFRLAERRRFELLIPFWSIHAFQACLLSHSSISPELPCNTDRTANIRIIC